MVADKPTPGPDDNIQCPVCGYYCLGNGGHGCIDKPGFIARRNCDPVDPLKPGGPCADDNTPTPGPVCEAEAKLLRVREAISAATEAGAEITDSVLRDHLEHGAKGTLAIVPIASWRAIRAALDGGD
jgi:hypothetical protein